MNGEKAPPILAKEDARPSAVALSCKKSDLDPGTPYIEAYS